MVTAEQASEVKARHSSDLLKMPGVCGVGTAVRDGSWVVLLHVDGDGDPTASWPEEIDGVPVSVQADGPFFAR